MPVFFDSQFLLINCSKQGINMKLVGDVQYEASFLNKSMLFKIISILLV